MAMSLKDIEQKNAELESLVFNLKMRLYYLTDKLRTNNISLADEEAYSVDERFSTKLREHDFRTVRLKEENEALRRRQVELETEAVELKSLLGSQNQTLVAATTVSNYSLAQVEENRRTERQAASAISQHDAALISRLQEEVAGLQGKQAQDSALVEDLADRLEARQEELRLSRADLEASAGRLAETREELEEVRDQLRRQDLVLESGMFQMESQGGQSVDVLDDESTGDVPSRGSLIYKARLEEVEVEEGKYSRAFMDLIQYKRLAYEMSSLRNENALLRTQLDRERQCLRRQEEQMYQLNTSAAEMTLLESNEVGRLAEELDRTKKARFAFEKRCYEAEGAVAKLRKEIEQLEQFRVDNALRESVDSSFDVSARLAHLALSPKLSRVAKEPQLSAIPNSEQYDKDLRSIEKTYLEREYEIMRTLESVVQRCKELETRLGLRALKEEQSLMSHQQ